MDRLAQRLLVGDSRSVILAEIRVGGNLVDTSFESFDLVLNLGDGARRINSDDRRLGNLKTKLNVSLLTLCCNVVLPVLIASAASMARWMRGTMVAGS